MNRAMGTPGWVELRKTGRAPGRDQILAFGSGRGRLNIRAAPGVTPVIEVAMGGPEPFLDRLGRRTGTLRVDVRGSLSESGGSLPLPPRRP